MIDGMFAKFLSGKALFVYGLFLSLFGMGVALYFQFFQGLEPCSLCIFQRLCYIAYGLIALFAIIHNPSSWGARFYAFLQVPVIILGVTLALRQVWIQSLPTPQVASCGPGLNFLLQEFSVSKVVQVVWAGSSDCALVSWRFWNLSMASWSAILFGVLLLVALFTLLKSYRSHKA
jgi:disulfide bond formation protein DsbB